MDRLEELNAIDETIRRERETIRLTPPDSPNLCLYISNLGRSFRRRFQLVGMMEDIDEAIDQDRKAIRLTTIHRDGRDLPALLDDLGLYLQDRFERFGRSEDIDEAIKQQREAIRLASIDGAGLHTCLTHLGISLMHRFQRYGDVKDIDEAIKQEREVVQQAPHGSPDLPIALSILGSSFIRRFDQIGEVKDLEEAIKYQREYIQRTSPNSPAASLGAIGDSLIRRFERFGEVKDIDEAIKYQLEAVRLTPSDSLNLPVPLNNLGLSLMRRFQRFGEVKDIDEAIKQQREAVRLTPSDHPYLPVNLNNLGLSFMYRFEHLGDVNDIDEAIKQQREAVHLTPSDSPDLPLVLNSLGSSFTRRFERFSKVEDINEAIEKQSKAVHLAPPNSPDLPKYSNNLGTSFALRFERFGKVEDIDEAIKQKRKAAQLMPHDSPGLHLYLNNVGLSYTRRFERLGEVEDIDEAIKQQREAVRLTPSDHPDLPVTLNNLGISFTLRFEWSSKLEDIDEAIKHQHKAVGLTPVNHPKLPIYLSNLGHPLKHRFGLLGNVKDVDETIEQLCKAVRLTPHDSPSLPMRFNNLGVAFTDRFVGLGEVKDINEAIKHLCKAVELTHHDSPDLALHLYHLGCSFMLQFGQSKEPEHFQKAVDNFKLASQSDSGPPPTCFHALCKLAHLTHKYKDLDTAMDAYTEAVNLLPLVAWIGLSADAQLQWLASESQTVACNAAACAIELADCHPDSKQQHLGHAIELLDHGRSVIWSQASNLQIDVEKLQVLDPTLAKNLDHNICALRQASFRDPNSPPITEEEAQAHHRAAEQNTQLIEHIRKLSGFNQFLLPPLITELQQAATGGHIVIINISEFRCDALLMQCKGPFKLIPLHGVTLDAVKHLAEDFSDKETVFGGRGFDSLHDPLHRTWSMFGKLIIEHIMMDVQSPLPRVWWCMTGLLTFVPIHACFPETSGPTCQAPGMMDLVISSYTPTISALLRAQQDSSPLCMLAVAQHEGGYDRDPLPCAKSEIDIVCRLSTSQPRILMGCDATVNIVADALKTCTWAHFACHGFHDQTKPMNSAFAMYDDNLTLAKVAQSLLHQAQFAFLSACHSGKGSIAFPNESLHIAAGMQFAGFRSVVGTMWMICDNDCLFIAEKFYEYIFKNGATSPHASHTASALHQAVQHLRKRENIHAARWVPFIHIGI